MMAEFYSEAVYRQSGFVETNLVHLTLGLADPTHAP